MRVGLVSKPTFGADAHFVLRVVLEKTLYTTTWELERKTHGLASVRYHSSEMKATEGADFVMVQHAPRRPSARGRVSKYSSSTSQAQGRPNSFFFC